MNLLNRSLLALFNKKQSLIKVFFPVILVLAVFKALFWFLEESGYWMVNIEFDTLFTIIGFALGVVLSRKIGNSYSKFLRIQDGFYSLHGKLVALENHINLMSPKKGTEIIGEWLGDFMQNYHVEIKGSNRQLRASNKRFYKKISEIGSTEHIPFHRLANITGSMFEHAIFIMTKRVANTPRVYDILLLQIIVFYLFLLVVFVPGVKGMISVVFAGYLFIGMYYITKDMDNPTGDTGEDHESDLIHLDVTVLDNYLLELQGKRVLPEEEVA